MSLAVRTVGKMQVVSVGGVSLQVALKKKKQTDQANRYIYTGRLAHASAKID